MSVYILTPNVQNHTWSNIANKLSSSLVRFMGHFLREETPDYFWFGTRGRVTEEERGEPAEPDTIGASVLGGISMT